MEQLQVVEGGTVEQSNLEIIQGAGKVYEALGKKGEELPGLIVFRTDHPNVILIKNFIRREDPQKSNVINPPMPGIAVDTYDFYGIDKSEGLIKGTFTIGRSEDLDFGKVNMTLTPCVSEADIEDWNENYDRKVTQLEKIKKEMAEELARRRVAVTEVFTKINGEPVTNISQQSSEELANT